VIGALADPVRLRIFSIIASQGETCSCNLEGPIGRSQPTISHHTSKLAAAGLIAGSDAGGGCGGGSCPEQVRAVTTALRVPATDGWSLRRSGRARAINRRPVAPRGPAR